MTATNHAMTGALIGLAVSQPLIALPLAVTSHFVCDALPHFDYPAVPEVQKMRSRWFRNMLIAETGFCFLIVLTLFIIRPEQWFLAAICAFLAASPDLFQINKYVKLRRGQPWHPNAFSRFAGRIQWFTKPSGAVVEIAWFIGCAILILPFLRAA